MWQAQQAPTPTGHGLGTPNVVVIQNITDESRAVTDRRSAHKCFQSP